ncbi:N-acetyl-D-Glu racemase DgcA [Tatumella ptyseos]|uniref:Dipeptide epimerase n=2 Tax=Tatumella ptyseos TaxID=82987 RepID=A0A085JQH8_9GAMM|nr:N-acetyl-D-Glu racemase DgcA [Tatumella ptyseos]KFD22724.1 muconate cycloisomerase [Tatumella ptyseos ATCC 33301]SQK71861.1 L-Ala-D/L-Glu epimerase [Tatumella ptyseos]
MRRMQIEVVDLPLARPFAIARGTRTSVSVVRVTLEEAGIIGLSECTPTLRYGETAESVCAQLALLKEAVCHGLQREELQHILPAGSARNALDCALWRLQAGRQGQDLWQSLQQVSPRKIVTAETLSLDSTANMIAAAEDAVSRGAVLLKIKLDQENILQKVAGVRSVAPESTLVIDANESWENQELPSLFTALADYRIAMVEQPLPAGRDDILRTFHAPFPVCADESCHTAEDIARLADRYQMINIKLDKCGGLTEALNMVSTARELQMRIMVGCMLGSSLAMEAALPVATAAEFVDLDGPVWLAGDSSPFLSYSRGHIWL